jgi:hypothetical protein
MATPTGADFNSEEGKEVLALIGLALLSSQATEQLLKSIIVMLIPEKPITSIEQLNESFNAEAKATLGQMLHKLRERTNLEPSFDGRLRKFLATRNHIAHDIKKLPGYDLATPEGREAASNALVEFIEESEFFAMRLLGIMRGWAIHVGMPPPEGTPEDVLRELDEQHVAAVEPLFGITIQQRS